MKQFYVLALLLTACVPTATPVPLPENPKIIFECKENGTTIFLSSFTPVYLPLLTVPRFPDGTIPVRYQFKDFTGMSELLKITWCPINATLEYSHKAGGERFTVGGP